MLIFGLLLLDTDCVVVEMQKPARHAPADQITWSCTKLSLFFYVFWQPERGGERRIKLTLSSAFLEDLTHMIDGLREHWVDRMLLLLLLLLLLLGIMKSDDSDDACFWCQCHRIFFIFSSPVATPARFSRLLQLHLTRASAAEYRYYSTWRANSLMHRARDNYYPTSDLI